MSPKDERESQMKNLTINGSFHHGEIQIEEGHNQRYKKHSKQLMQINETPSQLKYSEHHSFNGSSKVQTRHINSDI